MKTFILAAVAAALVAPAVQAQTSPTMTVRYADLNLGGAAGQQTLKSRIERAAKIVCGTGGTDLEMRVAYAQCVLGAVADAMTRVPERAPQFASR